ncbi:MAG TPA: hypothetical protein VLH13_00050 [Methanomassiliicoccales archaeon]|nr:hypothetical protein [Methanomassiliicoccales archaeon]
MGGYRSQIRRACLMLGRKRRPFDYLDVLNNIPDGPYKPTHQQTIQELSRSEYLQICEKGDINHRGRTRTKYLLRKRGAS